LQSPKWKIALFMTQNHDRGSSSPIVQPTGGVKSVAKKVD
jgi:hypothetical protein